MAVALSLCLFMAGGAAYCLFRASEAGGQAREQVMYLVECHPGEPSDKVMALRDWIKGSGWVRTTGYVSPDRAALLLAEDELDVAELSGKDSLPPLPAMLTLHFRKEAFEEPARIDSLMAAIRQHPTVAGIYAQTGLADAIEANLQSLGRIFLVIAAGLILFCIFLLSALLRLALYAHRHEIKTMQLVGASPSTIRRPYLVRYGRMAVVSALVVTGILWLAHTRLNGTSWIPSGDAELKVLAFLAGGSILLALLLILSVTSRVVNKYIFADLETLF